jgi:hypothetical protein
MRMVVSQRGVNESCRISAQTADGDHSQSHIRRFALNLLTPFFLFIYTQRHLRVLIIALLCDKPTQYVF